MWILAIIIILAILFVITRKSDEPKVIVPEHTPTVVVPTYPCTDGKCA